MPKKVTWKKGMRLSADIFDAADSAREEALRQTVLLGAAGRYGLFASPNPFGLTLNVTNNFLEIRSLSCHAVTKGGHMIDIEFDSDFTHTFDTQVAIPTAGEDEAFFLVVKIHDKEWREVNELYSETRYTFELVGEHSPIGDDSLPVGYIVNRYGWRLDEMDFVPPCLSVSAHPKYLEQLNRTKEYAKSMAELCSSAENCAARTFLASVWPAAMHAAIRLDKERDTLTPNALFAEVQQLVGAFVIGCTLDRALKLENRELFVNYLQKPYDAAHVYRHIEQGLSLCADISHRVGLVAQMTETPEPPQPGPKQEPKPKPKPKPADPVPPKPGRKLWDGYKI